MTAGSDLVRQDWAVDPLPAPHSLIVRMDITNWCNLDCIHCTLALNRERRGDPEGDMPLPLFEKIAAEVFPYAREVALSCMAEPIVHRQFNEILEVASRYQVPSLSLTTNGTSLTKRKIATLLGSGLKGVNLSLDGATPETFERLRRPGRFDKVTQGIAELAAEKYRRGLGQWHHPLLQVNYTLMKSTLDELPAMIELCRQWQVARLTLQHVYDVDTTGLESESLVSEPTRSDQALADARALCESYGIEPRFPPSFAQSSEGPPPTRDPDQPSCLAPWQMLRIWPDGRVQPCDLFQDDHVGDLGKSSFPELWAGAHGDLRRQHLARSPENPRCRTCHIVTTDDLEGRGAGRPIAFAWETDMRNYVPLADAAAAGDPEAPARILARVARVAAQEVKGLEGLSGDAFYQALARVGGGAEHASVAGGVALVVRSAGVSEEEPFARYLELVTPEAPSPVAEELHLALAWRATRQDDPRWADLNVRAALRLGLDIDVSFDGPDPIPLHREAILERISDLRHLCVLGAVRGVLDDLEGAIDYYREYVTRAPDAPDREDAERQIRQLQERLAESLLKQAHEAIEAGRPEEGRDFLVRAMELLPPGGRTEEVRAVLRGVGRAVLKKKVRGWLRI